MRNELVKRDSAGELVLSMMIWGVVSVLGIRLYLELTNYPQVGGGQWHIAHAVWGGLLMVVAMLITLIFHGEKSRKLSAIIAGIGLGQFIDEIGKLLSADNDYFFQPAIIFIYIFFVLLFLVYRYLERTTPKDTKTKLYQAINSLEEIAEGDFEKREKELILKNLDLVILGGSPETRRFASKLKLLVEETEPKEDRLPSWEVRTWEWLRYKTYHVIFKKKLVRYGLIMLALVYTVSGLLDTINLSLGFSQGELERLVFEGVDLTRKSDLMMFVVKTFFELVAGSLFVVGLSWVISRKPQKGMVYFQYGLLVNIFILSIFRFYFEQFSAVFSLLFTIAIYAGVKRLAREI